MLYVLLIGSILLNESEWQFASQKSCCHFVVSRDAASFLDTCVWRHSEYNFETNELRVSESRDVRMIGNLTVIDDKCPKKRGAKWALEFGRKHFLILPSQITTAIFCHLTLSCLSLPRIFSSRMVWSELDPEKKPKWQWHVQKREREREKHHIRSENAYPNLSSQV